MRSHLQLKAWILLVVFLTQIFSSSHLLFAGSGPSQPEMASFTPAGTTEMVDPFTGDFSYNIPLMDIEGYPINIAYNSGVKMEQEASWVGLGWNLNVGAIKRSVRGLPDDFNGDQVVTKTKMKPMKITKFGGGVGLELLGDEKSLGGLSGSTGLAFLYNNYKGFGLEIENSLSSNLSVGGFGAQGSVGLTINSLDGTTINTSLGMSIKKKSGENGAFKFGGNMGSGFNTRTGQSLMTLGTTAGYSASERETVKNEDGSDAQDEEGNVKTIDKSYGKSSGASSSFLPIGMNSYTPYPTLKMKSKTYSFSASVGGEFFTVNGNVKIYGSQTVQELINQQESTSAYGYLYEENAGRTALQDFNRDRPSQLNKTTKNIAPVNFTYDVFSVSGQGVSGTFRPFRNDIGILSDPSYSFDDLSSASFGGEIGLGAYGKGGVNYNTVQKRAYYGPWNDGNAASNIYKFRGNKIDYPYEKAYFKSAGEKTETDLEYFEKIGGFEPIAFTLSNNITSLTLKKGEGKGTSISPLPTKSDYDRLARSKVLSYLTAGEARFAALDDIKSSSGKFYTGTGGYNSIIIPRVDGLNRKPSHISEITQTNPNGERYIFGIPAYNLHKQEVSFTTNQNQSNANRIAYNATEASLNNSSGKDNYYSSTTTPPYAHSYLLTAKQSADYQDATGDGISPDDIGNAYEFSYQRTSSAYRWRVPYTGVSYQRGFDTNPLDQKGSFSYGYKEMWYLHTVQSKNQVAEFYISPRTDALGTGGIDGGKPSPITINDRSFKLDSILLFNKLDRLENKENAIPIKRVLFSYDYSLCKGVDNQENVSLGKLTLKKIEIAYGNSDNGKLSPYLFNYSDVNPNYNKDDVDRWGNYKPQSENPANMMNSVFPYSLQDVPDSTNHWAKAWNLEKIVTPSGSEIKVEYEADDYAFVQNKAAMQMVPIFGAGSGSSFTSNTTLYDTDHLYIKRPPYISTTATNQELREVFFGRNGSLDHLYFRVKTEVISNKYEYVSGYVKALDIGVASNTDYLYVKIIHQSPNSISKAAWGYFRQNLFDILYEQPNIIDTGLESLLKGLKANISDIAQMFGGVEAHLKGKNVANNFIAEQSFIRLYTPDKAKQGGGSRVKKLTINDKWNNFTGEGENSIYGQEYDYTKKLNGKVISSGVATYEPMIGNDENPFRVPVPYIAAAARGHIPAIEAYQEKPFGETFFPGASVGYSKVTVKDIHHDEGTTANTVTENNFYTAKDFPVLVRETRIQLENNPATGAKMSFPLGNLTKNTNFSASQGYSIILNDMHGKPQSTVHYGLEMVVNGSDTSIVRKDLGGSIYNYHTKEIPEGKMLDNKVEVLSAKGYVEEKLLGVEYDLAIDSRRSFESSSSTSRQLNADIIPGIFGIPFPIPSGYFKTITDNIDTRTINITKVIQTYGIVKSIRTFTDQYEITAHNRMYDGVTGDVILTETVDEHGKNEFQYTIPAHVVEKHDRMGPVYENIGFTSKIFNIGDSCNGSMLYTNTGYLKHGDELLINPKDGTPYKAWVKSNTKNPEYNQDCRKKYKRIPVHIEYPLDIYNIYAIDLDSVSLCKPTAYFETDTLESPTREEMNYYYDMKMYHLKDEYADFINDWYDSTSGSGDIFQDTSSYSFCELYAYDSTGSPTFLTVLNTYAAYPSRYSLDNFYFRKFFDLNDTMNSVLEYSTWSSDDGDYDPCEMTRTHPDSFFKDRQWRIHNFIGDDTLAIYKVEYETHQEKYLKKGQIYLSAYRNSRFEEILEWAPNYKDSVFYFVDFYKNDFQNNFGCPEYEEVIQSSTTVNQLDSSCFRGFQIINNIGQSIDTLDLEDTLMVIRSGNRNLLMESSGTIVSSENPVKIAPDGEYLGIKTASDGLEILQANAKVYGEEGEVNNPFNNNGNKFLSGAEGIFRQDSILRYVSSRYQKPTIETSKDGYMEELPSLWAKEAVKCNVRMKSPVYSLIGGSSSGWQLVNDNTVYHVSGQSTESKNILGNYTARIFNYRGTPEVVISNSKQRNVASDNFENYYAFGTYGSLPQNQFWSLDFSPNLNGLLYSNGEEYQVQNNPAEGLFYGIAHTGKYSVFANGQNPYPGDLFTLNYKESQLISLEQAVLGEPFASGQESINLSYNSVRNNGIDFFKNGQDNQMVTALNQAFNGTHFENNFELLAGDSSGTFKPENGEYVFSIWVKELLDPKEPFYGQSANVLIKNGNDSTILYPAGPIIDGWRKIEGIFNYENTNDLIVSMKGGLWGAFFDDLRIHPKTSNINTYVYDRITNRIKAKLDENNYAVFYEYNPEGIPSQVKKETDLGIVTVSESRQSLNNHPSN